jgi:hypothetical protein
MYTTMPGKMWSIRSFCGISASTHLVVAADLMKYFELPLVWLPLGLVNVERTVTC